MSPHPNEMASWDEIVCQRGCESHPTRVVDIHLGGPTKYRDLTPIPARFAMDFQIEVFDTDLTPVDGGPYCPARDAVSETILSHGVWEPRETTVLLLAWEACGPSVEFIDVGAQLGWFSTVARSLDVWTHSIEADADVARVALKNAAQGDLLAKVQRLRISSRTPPWLPLFNGPDEVKVVKIDIEGAEADAITMLAPLIDTDRVPFILMEVSPCFNDSYPDLVTDLISRGYSAYMMPPKQNPPVVIDQLMDLAPYQLVGDLDDIAAQVASWHQEDLLFVLGGVEAWQ